MNHLDNIAENYLKFNYCTIPLKDLRQDLHYAMVKFAEWIDSADRFNREHILSMSYLNYNKLFDDVEVRKLTFTLLPFDKLWSDYNKLEQYKRLLSASTILKDQTYLTFKNTYFDVYICDKNNDEIPEYIPTYSGIEKSLKDLWV